MEKGYLLIDAENVSVLAVELAVKSLFLTNLFGNTAKLKVSAFGDWGRVGEKKKDGIKSVLVEVNKYEKRIRLEYVDQKNDFKGSNSSDVAMIIEGMKILHNNTKKIGFIGIVSSDCDFKPFIEECSKGGVWTIGFLEKGKTKAGLSNAYDTSILYSLDQGIVSVTVNDKGMEKKKDAAKAIAKSFPEKGKMPYRHALFKTAIFQSVYLSINSFSKQAKEEDGLPSASRLWQHITTDILQKKSDRNEFKRRLADVYKGEQVKGYHLFVRFLKDHKEYVNIISCNVLERKKQGDCRVEVVKLFNL